MKNKKSMLYVLGACLVVGIIYAVASILPEAQAKLLLIGIAVTMLIIWMVAKMVRMSKLSKIISGPTHLLYEEKEPVLYVEEMQEILNKVSGKQQKDLVRINIAAGQVYAGQYEQALETLEVISVAGQPEVNRVLCYAYETMADFLSGKYNALKSVMDEQRKLLKKYDSTTSGLTNNVLLMYAFELIAKGEYTEALERLDSLKGRKVSSILQDMVDFSYLECYRNLKKVEERKQLLEQMKERTLVPAIKNKISEA